MENCTVSANQKLYNDPVSSDLYSSSSSSIRNTIQNLKVTNQFKVIFCHHGHLVSSCMDIKCEIIM